MGWVVVVIVHPLMICDHKLDNCPKYALFYASSDDISVIKAIDCNALHDKTIESALLWHKNEGVRGPAGGMGYTYMYKHTEVNFETAYTPWVYTEGYTFVCYYYHKLLQSVILCNIIDNHCILWIDTYVFISITAEQEQTEFNILSLT